MKGGHICFARLENCSHKLERVSMAACSNKVVAVLLSGTPHRLSAGPLLHSFFSYCSSWSRYYRLFSSSSSCLFVFLHFLTKLTVVQYRTPPCRAGFEPLARAPLSLTDEKKTLSLLFGAAYGSLPFHCRFMPKNYNSTKKSFYGSPPNFSLTKTPVLKPAPGRIS